MDADTLLHAIAIPVAVAAFSLLVLRLLGARQPWLRSPAITALAAAAAVVLSARHQFGGLAWPPAIALDRFPMIVGGTAIVGTVAAAILAVWRRKNDASARTPHVATLATIFAAALAAAAPLFLLRLPGAGAPTYAIGTALIVLVASCVAWASARKQDGPTIPIAMWATGAAGAGLAALASVAKLSHVLGTFSAVSAAIAVLAVFQRPLIGGAPVAAVWATTIGCAALLGMHYDEAHIPLLSWWLLAASPAGALAACAPWFNSRPRTAGIVRTLMPTGLAFAALAIAAAAIMGSGASKDSPDEPAYTPYTKLTGPTKPAARMKPADDGIDATARSRVCSASLAPRAARVPLAFGDS